MVIKYLTESKNTKNSRKQSCIGENNLIISPLSGDQKSLLTSNGKDLILKHIKKSWCDSLSAKQVQITKSKDTRVHDPISKLPLESGISSDESSSEMEGSDEESESCIHDVESVEDSVRDSLNTVKSMSKREGSESPSVCVKYENSLPRLVVEGSILKTRFSNNRDNKHLSQFFEIPDKKEIDSVSMVNHLNHYHKNLMQSIEKARRALGFFDLDNTQKYLCYKALLNHDIICLNPTDDECSIYGLVPPFASKGVTLIVEANRDRIRIRLDKLVKGLTRMKGTSTMDGIVNISDIVGKDARPERPVAFIANEIRSDRLKGPKIIFATLDHLQNENILKSLLEIQSLGELIRIVHVNIKTLFASQAIERFQATPHTLILDCVGLVELNSIATDFAKSKTKSLEKAILFPLHSKKVSFFVERKLHEKQVAQRIHHILRSFMKEKNEACESILKHTDIKGEVSVHSSNCEEHFEKLEYPKCICYCMNEGKCKSLQSQLETLSISSEILTVTSSKQKISNVVRNFREGNTRIICTTKAHEELKYVPDVRFIFHSSVTNSLDQYVQETLFAGLDGNPSFCFLFFRLAEMNVWKGKQNAKKSGYESECDEIQSMLKYGMYGDINLCRQKIFYDGFISKEVEKRWRCEECDYCKLSKSLLSSNTIDELGEKKIITEYSITWIAEKILEKLQRENKYILRQHETHAFLNEENLQTTIGINASGLKEMDLKELLSVLIKFGGHFSVLNDFIYVLVFLHFFQVQNTDRTTNSVELSKALIDLKEKSFKLIIRDTSQIQIFDSQSKTAVTNKHDINVKCLLESKQPHVISKGIFFSCFPKAALLQWLKQAPFSICFEICRLCNVKTIEDVTLDSQIIHKIRRSDWDWHDRKMVDHFLNGLNPYDAIKMQNITFKNSHLYLSAQFGCHDDPEKLELLPASHHKHTNRVFHKYGSHRFLHIHVKYSQRRHLDKLILGTQGKALVVCSRKYRFLWVEKHSYPQIYIFFAEEGLGISNHEETTVDDVRDWCVPISLNKNMTRQQQYDGMAINFKRSIPSSTLPSKSLQIVEDIKNDLDGSLMTDGCGLVSLNMLDFVWEQTQKYMHNEIIVANDSFRMKSKHKHSKRRYSSFQGYIGGLFGMWILDTNLGDGMRVVCRKSQMKFIVNMRSCTHSIDSEVGSRIINDDLHDTFYVMNWNDGPLIGKIGSRMIQLLKHRGVDSVLLEDHGITTEVPGQFTNAENDENKVYSSTQNSKWLRLVPDHTQLLEEGEAFITGMNENYFNSDNQNHTSIVVMREFVYFAGDLVKLRIPSRSVLRRRSMALSKMNNKNEIYCCSKYDSNRTDPYAFFEEIIDECLILSTKGVKSASYMMSGGRFDGGQAWVCWERKMVATIKICDVRESCEINSKEKGYSKDLISVSERDRFNDAWRYRNYCRDMRMLNVMMDTFVDLYGFSDLTSKAVAKELLSQSKAPNYELEVSEHTREMFKNYVNEHGYPLFRKHIVDHSDAKS